MAYDDSDLSGLRTDLQDRLAALSAREVELRAELARVHASIKSLGSALTVLADEVPRSPASGETPRMTIKEGVVKVLEQVAPGGLSAISILERLRVNLDLDYPRTSLSPQLSRLKKEGQIKLVRGVWFLVKRQSGPGAEAPEPS